MLAQPTKDEGAVSERPSETQPTPSPTHPSEDQSEPQPDLFLRPSSSNPISDSIPEGSGGNHGDRLDSTRIVTTQAANIKDLKAQIKQLKKKARPVINHYKVWIKSLSMKKRLYRKKKDGVLYPTREENFQIWTVKDSEETRVSTEDQVSTDKPKVSTDKPKVSTDKLKVSTDKPNEGTAEPNEGTAEPKDGNSDESAAPTTIFRDDETIAQFLVTMSQNKTKQKGVEIKEIKDTDRPRTTTERSILTLKPLPKIDPKDKGKKVLEEKAESDAESEGVNEAEKKFKMLAMNEDIAKRFNRNESRRGEKSGRGRQLQQLQSTNEYDYYSSKTLIADKILLRSFKKKREKSSPLSKEPITEEEKIDYEVLGTRYPIINWESKFYDYGHFGRELIYYRVFRADGSSRWIKTFSKMINFFDRMDLVEIHSLVMKRFETTPLEGIDLLLWVHVLRLEDSTKINMLAERRYPLTKNTLERMTDLRLTAVSYDDTVFDLLRFIEQQIDEFGGQDGIQKQTAFGKDKLNPLIVDSLLKTIRLSIHLVVYNEELAIPEQTATEGKLKENQGCRVDTDQVHQNGDLKNRSVWIHPPGLQDVYTKET
ncbi:hypothetical protein Tco_1392208 [Tanacetum coccineum]